MAKLSKLVKTSIAATTAMVTVVPVVSAADVKDFNDVDQTNSHYEAIMALANKGVIKGYPDGSFGVSDTLQRKHGAVLLYNALKLETPSNVEEVLASYNDIDVDSDYAEQIAAVTEAGIFKGKTGAFDSKGDLTREQMATVLVLSLGLQDTGVDVDMNLENVSPSHKNNVKILAQHGITNQLDDFRPHESVTRGQFATFLYLAQQKVVESVDHIAPIEDAYVPTGNEDFNIFNSMEFFTANNTSMSYVDTSSFKVFDSEGIFNEDGTLVEAYAEGGLTDDLIGSTITVQVKNAADEEVGKFEVEIVNGGDIKAISKGTLLKGDTVVDFATLGSEFQFDVTEVITYNSEVVGDDEHESIELENFEGLDISSSDNSVFVVTNTGTITPIKEGKADVIVKWQDKSFAFPVEVKAAPTVDAVEFVNGSTSYISSVFNQTVNEFVVVDQYGQEIANPGNLEVVPVNPTEVQEGLTVTLNGNTVEVNGANLTESVVASYAIQTAEGDVLGEFNVEYYVVGETVDYHLVKTSDEDVDTTVDYNSEDDASINIGMIGVDAEEYISEVPNLSEYTVELTGVTEGKEEATLVMEEDGSATLHASEFASAAGNEVIVVVKEGNIVITQGVFTVKNTTPAPAELENLTLAEGVEAITISGDTNFDAISEALVGTDQYGEAFDLSTVAAELHSSDELIFTVDGETIDLADAAVDGDTAQLTVTIDDVVKVFDVVVDVEEAVETETASNDTEAATQETEATVETQTTSQETQTTVQQ